MRSEKSCLSLMLMLLRLIFSRAKITMSELNFYSRRGSGASFSVTERVTEIDYFMLFMVN